MLSAEVVEDYICLAKKYEEAQSSVDRDSTIFSTTIATAFSSLGIGSNAMSSTTSYTSDAHAVSDAEAQFYYAGLHSEPTLLYRTGKKWSPSRGLEAQCHLKELCEVFNHPIRTVWNHDLGWRVVKILDAHTVSTDEEDANKEIAEAKKPPIGPVTIWIGVFPESTSATAAHNAAQDILALLKDYQITDVDVDFRESFYTREANPQLLKPVSDLDPLVDVISPLTPTLGLHISTKARPDTQGTMALYLAEGGSSDNLLGLSCRHVLIESKEANVDYVYHLSRPRKDVILFGNRALTNLINSIKLGITRHGIMTEYRKRQIEQFKEREKGTNAVDIENAKVAQIKTQRLLEEEEEAVKALEVLLNQVNKDWKRLKHCIFGHILCSPAISLGVGEQHFTEDWGIFQINQVKLGDGFQGNKMDLGTKLTPDEFTLKCFPHGDLNWKFKYPNDHLLPLMGIITDDLMHAPDMWNSNGDPCLLVIKSGSATNTTIGRANGIFSIIRDYFQDMSINQTSMEWAIINYDSKSEVFSEPGDSGSIIADIRGRIGGMLTGGSGKAKSPDITYATPFWWLLKRIKANGFPNVHLSVIA
ncbi:uncharacterized protein BT62DRAFT_1030868 [Guyanagaster necrorhizus]|uniref:Uncharacterized protein n=1 Tax=Guyanagaster necrorhizus TaxID=856835 RepID=A0A9P7W370_9AGAR|nr:uncharacterized protein BT62DRAFT_1030868 [Guyanagaster necrorhizus MCA 3950]KAG7451734.1 hypothetical protein BT62DRAFT_1030868 [Guyanagaster necrorhizus MCA 3950]